MWSAEALPILMSRALLTICEQHGVNIDCFNNG
jgi:hypothetical protein